MYVCVCLSFAEFVHKCRFLGQTSRGVSLSETLRPLLCRLDKYYGAANYSVFTVGLPLVVC